MSDFQLILINSLNIRFAYLMSYLVCHIVGKHQKPMKIEEKKAWKMNIFSFRKKKKHLNHMPQMPSHAQINISQLLVTDLLHRLSATGGSKMWPPIGNRVIFNWMHTPSARHTTHTHTFSMAKTMKKNVASTAKMTETRTKIVGMIRPTSAYQRTCTNWFKTLYHLRSFSSISLTLLNVKPKVTHFQAHFSQLFIRKS